MYVYSPNILSTLSSIYCPLSPHFIMHSLLGERMVRTEFAHFWRIFLRMFVYPPLRYSLFYGSLFDCWWRCDECSNSLFLKILSMRNLATPKVPVLAKLPLISYCVLTFNSRFCQLFAISYLFVIFCIFLQFHLVVIHLPTEIII